MQNKIIYWPSSSAQSPCRANDSDGYLGCLIGPCIAMKVKRCGSRYVARWSITRLTYFSKPRCPFDDCRFSKVKPFTIIAVLIICTSAGCAAKVRSRTRTTICELFKTHLHTLFHTHVPSRTQMLRKKRCFFFFFANRAKIASENCRRTRGIRCVHPLAPWAFL